MLIPPVDNLEGVHALIEMMGSGFHPDTPGADYHHDEEAARLARRPRLFSDAEADKYDAALAQAAAIARAEGTDLYALAVEIDQARRAGHRFEVLYPQVVHAADGPRFEGWIVGATGLTAEGVEAKLADATHSRTLLRVRPIPGPRGVCVHCGETIEQQPTSTAPDAPMAWVHPRDNDAWFQRMYRNPDTRSLVDTLKVHCTDTPDSPVATPTDTGPSCAMGHPLVLMTKATFWLTVEDGKVSRAVVTADAGDAGTLDPHPFGLWSCTGRNCEAEVDPDAIDAAIKIADETDWPAPELEG